MAALAPARRIRRASATGLSLTAGPQGPGRRARGTQRRWRRRAQAARAAGRALRAGRRAVATAAHWQVSSGGGLRLWPPGSGMAAAQESALEAATVHARRTAMHQPAHADSGIGGPGSTRLGAMRPTRSEENAALERHSSSGTGPAILPRSGAGDLARSRECSGPDDELVEHSGDGNEEGPVSSRR